MSFTHAIDFDKPKPDITTFPQIIQGGMGIAVSGYRLANAVAKAGQMGVVSGTVIDVVHARELMNGDPTGDLRRAYSHFPDQEMAQRVLDRYFCEDGKDPFKAFKNVPSWADDPPVVLVELCIVANFAEVWLAKEGHNMPIGINYLEKVQLPHVTSVIGAMLAGVDAVLMGAGIPKQMPGLIRTLSKGQEGIYNLTVDDALPGEVFPTKQDPKKLFGCDLTMKPPAFLAIITSHTLAQFLAKDPETRPDGFVVELPVAGGHNAPPRGQMKLDEEGQPIYGDRDMPDFEKIREVGLPFYIAGGWGRPNHLKEARELGAKGVQVGTAFAFSDESGFDPRIKKQVFDEVKKGGVKVFTDPVASPSGFPFKVIRLEGTSSEEEVYQERKRVCDVSYLRSCYRKDDGTVGYRCSAEPVKHYVRKGGKIEDTIGKKCLCNALMSNAGLGQIRKGGVEEPMLVTSGDEVTDIVKILGLEKGHYSASEVIDFILSDQ